MTPEGSFFLPDDVRYQHCYIIGKSRTGKTNLGKVFMVQDMRLGHGLSFLDPNGDAALDVLGLVPKRRFKDVIYFEPARKDCPSFNILALRFEPHKLTDDIIAIFKANFASWGDQMEHILRHCLLTLLHDRVSHTLKDVRSLLIDESYQAAVVSRLRDADLKAFWTLEFPNFSDNNKKPLLTRLGKFLAPGSIMSRVFSSEENDIDFQEIMDGRKIFIANIAKGSLGQEEFRIFGGLLVTGLQMATLARAATVPNIDDRIPHYLYMDEFQNFLVDSISEILEESSKYKLYLTLMNQTLDQLRREMPKVEKSITGNVGTIFSFRVDPNDAAVMCKNMRKVVPVCRRRGTNNYISIEKFAVIARDHLAKRLADLKKERRRTFQRQPSWEEEELQRDIATLSARNLISEAVKEITEKEYQPKVRYFRDYEFKELIIPTVHGKRTGITELPNFRAYCRIVETNNVHRIKTAECPKPDPDVQAALIKQAAERYQERQKRQAERTVETDFSSVPPEDFPDDPTDDD